MFKIPRCAYISSIIVLALSVGMLFPPHVASEIDPRKFKSDEESNIAIFDAVSPSVVFIKNASLQIDWFSAEYYEVPRGAGSGFVWDDSGHVVTNFHVIYQADKIDVVLADQKNYPAKVVGYSPDHDLAVLKIEAPREILKAVPVGSSNGLKVGQKVLAIGNPFGLDYSLTTGVVSALGRTIRALTGRKIFGAIQTDAAINTGNSGGPLLDSYGRLIGVTTAIFSPSGASAGVGFAIPVDTVKRVVPQLIAHGKFKKVGLGVILLPDNIRDRLGLKGAVILKIITEGPAHRAGLQPTYRSAYSGIVYGDIITQMDDTKITNNEDLIEYIEKNKRAGDRIKLKFIRKDKEYETTAVLKDLDDL